jgi:sugar phosphate isomerase/epimerase
LVKLGFVSAIVPELSLEQTIDFAQEENFGCVELMCWPMGKSDRRYAGVTHIDVDLLDEDRIEQIVATTEAAGVSISGLGYYPNPLCPDQTESTRYVDHIEKVIRAAATLDINQVNTFIGRDPAKSVDASWPRFLQVWKPLIKLAEDSGVRIGIENCPMYFTKDEWPAGKNLAINPEIWTRMFSDIPSKSFGLNYDPSHFVWQQMDYLAPMREFADKLFHIHAKDVRVDRHRLDRVGILAHPLEYHLPKLPGLGDVDWGKFFSVLSDTGYTGPVCIEVEDRAYEKTLESRKAAIRQSGRFLRNFVG